MEAAGSSALSDGSFWVAAVAAAVVGGASANERNEEKASEIDSGLYLH